MKQVLPIMVFFLCISYSSFSQSVGIGTASPDSSAQLDIANTNKGLLIPRMNISSILLISKPAKGLMAYDSVNNQLMVNTGTPTAPKWQSIVANSGWSLAGNTGTKPLNQFIGTNDNAPLHFRINNQWAGQVDSVSRAVALGLGAGINNGSAAVANVALGNAALNKNTTGNFNTAIGDSAGYSIDNLNEAVFIGNRAGRGRISNTGQFSVYIGSHAGDSAVAGWSTIIGNYAGVQNSIIGNVMIGSEAGRHNTIGVSTFVGNNAGWSNTTGNLNTLIGSRAGFLSTTANENTVVGFEAMRNNVTGSFNTAVGVDALTNDSIGQRNTAIGTFSQFWNNSVDNTSVGYESLNKNISGFQNTAIGTAALFSNLTGAFNAAMGDSALFSGSGLNNSFNTAVGTYTLLRTSNSNSNVAIGYKAGGTFDMGSGNVLIGATADASGPGFTNSVALGANAFITASNQVKIGNPSTTSIGGFANWTNFSDGRFKKNIQEDVKGIDFIMKLRPVTYQLDLDGINAKITERTGVAHPSFMKNNNARAKEVFSGFVAQEVEQAAKATGYEFSGVDKPGNENDFYGLRYSDFVAPVVKAVQELVKQNQDLEQQIQQLKGINNTQKAQYDELLKRIEKLEANKK